MDRRAEHLNRVLKTLRDVSRVVVRAEDADALLQGACDVLIAGRGFFSAWIVLWNRLQQVQAGYQCGCGEGFQEMLHRLRAGERPRCLDEMVDHRRPVVIDGSDDPCGGRSPDPRTAGRTTLALPILHERELLGVLGVTVPPEFAQEPEELELLGELSDVLGHALTGLRARSDCDRLQRILEASPSVVFRWGIRDGWPVLFVTRNVHRFGYAPEDFLSGRIPYESILHPEDHARVLAEVVAAVDGPDDAFTQLYRVRDGSGNWRWVEDHTRIERDAGGRAVAMQGVVTDITARKQSEEALSASEARLRAVLDAAHGVPVQGYDSGRRVVFWNRASEDLYGYSRAEALGRRIEELIIPEAMREEVIEAIRAWHEDGIPIPAGELVLHDREGRAVPVFSSHGMIVNHRGEKEMYCIDLDLSRLQHAEQALRESEDRYRALAENYPGGALILFDRDLRYLSAGGQEFARVGLRPEDVVGRHVREVFPEVADEIVPHCEAVFAGDDRYYEVEYKGEIYSNQLIPVRDEVGEIVCGLAVTRNITARKQMEQRVQQLQKLEAVGRLAGGVAHDFNNMLTVILGNVENARGSADLPAAVQASLAEIGLAAERSADLTRQLLGFARRQTIAPRVLDLNDTIAGMLDMFRRLIGEDIELVWSPADAPLPVKIDPSQVDQLMANLCLNARDAIAGVGRLTIETFRVSLDARAVAEADCEAGEYVQLAVSDDGCGMDVQTRDRIFEPFFTTKAEGRGTGLGLATVFGIVRQNGGLINVYSEPGRGSTFRIYLPCHAAAGPAAGPPQHAEGDEVPSGEETVLLVEDEEAILRLSQAILQGLGYRVLAATSPEQAIALAERAEGAVHLLITDVVMPRMNGRELYDRLAAARSDLRCLYTSGYTANVIAHHGVLDPGVAFLQKPFTRSELAREVRAVLDAAG